MSLFEVGMPKICARSMHPNSSSIPDSPNLDMSHSAGDFCTIERVMRCTLKRRDRRLFADPKPSLPEMCSTLGISRSTLSRSVREAKKAADRPEELYRNRPHNGSYTDLVKDELI